VHRVRTEQTSVIAGELPLDVVCLLWAGAVVGITLSVSTVMYPLATRIPTVQSLAGIVHAGGVA